MHSLDIIAVIKVEPRLSNRLKEVSWSLKVARLGSTPEILQISEISTANIVAAG